MSLSGFTRDDFRDAIPRRTTFFTSNILTCLQNIPGHTADVCAAAAQFLIGQKSERWSFNYWACDTNDTGGASGRTGAPRPPYPDDLDDTFAAFAALAGHDPAIIDGHAFAAIARLLTAREAGEGGPYRTWLVDSDAAAAWQDVDVVVNGTIGYFLSLIGVRLPQLEYFMDSAVRKGRLASPYYPGIFHVGYFLSRFYKANKARTDVWAAKRLADILLARLLQNSGTDITPLECAMAISSFINLGYADKIPVEIPDLLAARTEREGFLPYAFCIDPTRGGRRCYAGASALTAAFCAQALAQYPPQDRNAFGYASAIADAAARAIDEHDHIRGLARDACRGLDINVRAMALAQINKTSDKKITTLAYEFREALYKNGKIVPFDIVEQLSLANLYGWMAYDIYDDALDGEGGHDPSPLPCANFFLRALMEIYSTLNARIPGIRSLFDDMMNRMDDANAWERGHCRIAINSVAPRDGASPRALPSFGGYQTLADRSIGHAMGPLAELLYAGYAPSSEEYKNTESFFRHYLIARQLHDDAHDWAEDLLHGRVNSIGALVLQRFRERHRNDRGDGSTAPAADIIPELRKIFWEETINDAVHMIDARIAAARQARERFLVLAHTDFMENALRILASGARRAIKERNEALIFLKDYKAVTAHPRQGEINCL